MAATRSGRSTTRRALWAPLLMLLLGAWHPPVTCSQFIGSARVNGVETDFYRVPAPAADRPYPMPPHPKWLAGGERPAFAQQLSRLRRQPRLDTPSDRPHAATQGKVLGVCLLVDFSDRLAQAPWTRQHYLDMLFSLGTYASGSLRDYFLEDSYGLLDVRGTVVNGSGGNLTGWFRAPQTHGWYCNNQQGLGPYPQNAQKLVEDAIALADPVVDFSRYASGGSGTMVDLLHVVHAGTSSQLSKLTTDFATCKWSTSAVVSADGVYCLDYALEAEDDAIGPFAHESSHLMGAPDLYDADAGAFINQWDSNDYPVAEWCLMAEGSWGGPNLDGTCPSHHCGLLKAQFGWVLPSLISPMQGGTPIPVTDLETQNGPQSVYLLSLNASEYLLIENRSHAAAGTTFDRWSWWPYPPGPASRRDGIVIYHVDTREPTGLGRLNDGWPNNTNYHVWVEDPGMSPDAMNPGTMTAAPLQEGKAHAAFRLDGVGRLAKDNLINNTAGLPRKLYPTTRDNAYGAAGIEWIDILSTPGPSMNIRVQFTPVMVTFQTNTVGTSALSPTNQAVVDFTSFGVVKQAMLDDANPVVLPTDPCSPYLFHALSIGSLAKHQWQADPSQAFGTAPATPGLVRCNFHEQWAATVGLVNTNAAHPTSVTAQTFCGQSVVATGLSGSWTGWCDDGTVLTFAPQTLGTPPRPAVGKRSWTVVSAITRTVTYDAANPTVTIGQPASGDVFWSGPTGPNQTISGTATDDVGLARVCVKVNAGAWVTATGTSTWSANVTLAPGPNTVKAQARDKAGNRDTQGLTLYYDTAAPTLTLSSPSKRTAYRSSSITASGVCTDDCGLRTIRARVGASGAWTDLLSTPPFPRRKAWWAPLSLSPGRNTVEVKAVDRAGHATRTTLALYYDTAQPTITISAPATGSHQTTNPCLVQGTAGDDVGLQAIDVRVGTGAWQPAWAGNWRASVNWQRKVVLAAGRNVVAARATDQSGRTRTTSSVVWLDLPSGGDAVASAPALVTALSVSPTRCGGAGCAFTLSAPATVDADVLNLAGRPVRRLCAARPLPAGTQTLAWNATSDTGLPVPSGTYLLRVTARSRQGSQSTALAQMRIER